MAIIKYSFTDLVDIPRVQRLMDLFFKATGILTAMVTPEGSVLTRSGWQDICSRFHRINPDTRQRCLESDTYIANKIESGQKYSIYQCRNGLIDAAVPIVVEGEHVANFFTGQFLFQPPDLDFFRKQANEFGFDEAEYLSCVEKVPVMDEARLQPFLDYFAEFAELLSDIGIRQLKHRVIEEQLRTSEARMNRTQEIALLGSWELEIADHRLYWSDQVYRIFGFHPQEFNPTYETFLDRVHPDDRAAVDEAYTGSLREGRDVYEIEHRVVRKSDGAIRTVHEKCEHIRDASGRVVRSIGMVHDITERKKVEETLKESEQRYRSLFENMLEGFVYCQMIFDEGRPKDFIYLDVNNAFEVLTGLRNVIGKKVSEVIPGLRATDPELYDIFGGVASTGTPERFERYIEALGMWVSVSTYSPRKDHFVAVFDVITERKRAEEALRRTHDELEIRVKERTAELESAHFNLKSEVEERKRTEEFIKAARDLSMALSSTSDLTHALELCLDTAFFVSGMDIAVFYLVDRHSGDVNLAAHRNLPPELLSRFSHYDKDTANAQIVRACDPVYTVFQDLGIPDVRLSLRAVAILPICYEETAVACLILASLKFDEIGPSVRMALETVALQVGGALIRIQTEGERKRLAAAVEHAAEGVIIVDPSWHIQYVNPAFISMTGYSQEESIKKEISFLRPDNADHDAYEAARRRVSSHTWFISRLAQTRKDGSSFPVESSMSSLMDSDGKIRGYVLLWRDISERVELEERLRQSQKMEAIGTLAGGIAHDFNNILAAIFGFTEMAIDDVADRPPVEENLKKVLKSAMRGRDLVKQILAFSRKTNYERTALSLAPLVKETVDLLRASIPVTIEIKLTITVSSDTVLASPTEVQQILMNLATNASLAMEDGGILEIGLADIDFTPDSPMDDMAGEYVQLIVKDTGIGMSADVMKRAFEPFFTTRDTGAGTGMGLSVVYGIANTLGGTVSVESAPGMGSTFRVFLPKVKTESKEKDVIPNDIIPTGTESILFVDDEDLLVEWASITLQRLGYRATALTDPDEALQTFSSDPSRFDLVITDQAMPSMSGMKLARELLKIRPDIPIILCTGHSATVSPETAKQEGIREFLMKPLAKRELAEAIRIVLNKRNT